MAWQDQECSGGFQGWVGVVQEWSSEVVQEWLTPVNGGSHVQKWFRSEETRHSEDGTRYSVLGSRGCVFFPTL